MQNLAIKYFKKISTIPRCSKNLLGIRKFIKDEAKKFGHNVKLDGVNNILVEIKGNNGSRISSPVILQSHMDMVCEKKESSFHDFSKDQIEIIEENGYFKARDTTLGADNGTGLAIMIALMNEENKINHPDLELLFTVDEEVGLIGAFNLDPKLCKGKILINLDGDEDRFLVGCAGSLLLKIRFFPNFVKATKKQGVEIIFKGLKGGHSGIEIDRDLANSLKLIFYFLNELQLKMKFELVSIIGGDKANAIPREGKATVLIDKENISLLKEEIQVFIHKIRKMYPLEHDFEIIFNIVQVNDEVFEKISQEKFLNIGMAIMHGICKVENYSKRLIRTSLNFASLIIKDKLEFQFYLNIRSLVNTDKKYIYLHLKAISDLADAKVKIIYDFPAWFSDPNSKLIKHLKKVYKNEYGKFPKISVVHAGLETGIIATKFRGIEAVTIGTSVEFMHTPRERVKIQSIIRVYNFIKKSLESL